jgi:hypothetical protein
MIIKLMIKYDQIIVSSQICASSPGSPDAVGHSADDGTKEGALVGVLLELVEAEHHRASAAVGQWHLPVPDQSPIIEHLDEDAGGGRAQFAFEHRLALECANGNGFWYLEVGHWGNFLLKMTKKYKLWRMKIKK